MRRLSGYERLVLCVVMFLLAVVAATGINPSAKQRPDGVSASNARP